MSTPRNACYDPRPGAKISGTTQAGSWYLVVRPPGPDTIRSVPQPNEGLVASDRGGLHRDSLRDSVRWSRGGK